VITDSQGTAAAQSLRLNQLAGKMPIHVNASYRGLTAGTSITQFSVLPPGAKPSSGGGHRALVAVLVVLGAAAAGGGAYFATRKSTSSPSTGVVAAVIPVSVTLTNRLGSADVSIAQ
jgi:hypothetical protein